MSLSSPTQIRQCTQRNNVTITTSSQGVEFVLPLPAFRSIGLLSSLRMIQKGVPLLPKPYLLLGGVGWSLIGFLIISAWLTHPFQWPVVGWAAGWMLYGLSLLQSLLKHLFGKETLIITEEHIHIGTSLLGLKNTTRYDVSHMNTVRMTHEKVDGGGRLWFDDGARTIGFGQGLDEAEATFLFNTLTDILKFRCHLIERISFGTHDIQHETSSLFCNPDVSTLRFPFLRLQRIDIDAENHDVSQVERFLTYAVNYLGQVYLQKHVSAHISGKLETLHPNLKNALTNLCHHVSVHS